MHALNRAIARQTRELSLRNFLVHGVFNLAAATLIERALGFVANFTTARIAGPTVFGAYSVVISTANLFSTYAGADIGSTANRFAGQYPIGSTGYIKLIRHLLIVSSVSCLLATSLMFFGAPMLAGTILKAPQLEIALKWAAFSTGLTIVGTCCRGLFIGHRNFKSLLITCSLAAVGLVALLPMAAHIGVVAMVKAQIIATGMAIGAAGGIIWRLTRQSVHCASTEQNGPKLSTIAGFGLAQIGAVACISIASWWASVLLIRSDPSFVQMGFYSVSNQIRGVIAIGPTMLGQVAYSILTKESGSKYGGPKRITQIATYLNILFVSSLLVCLLPIVASAISLLYGNRYSGCEFVVTLGIATVVIHMSGVPAALRLSIVSIKTLTAINIVWTIAVVLGAGLMVPRYGAAGAVGAFFAAHVCSQILAAVVLWIKDEVDAKFLKLTSLTGGMAIGIVVLAWIQEHYSRVAIPVQVLSVLLPITVVVAIVKQPEISARLQLDRFRYARDFVS
jgi:O-antigen/teichoic acid export membrane protein